jgi:hypothetical protein
MIREVQSPINAIVGDKGACKTLMMTYLAEYHYLKENKNIYSNYKLNIIPYKKFSYDMLVDLPEDMCNGIILMDEIQMGSDAYEFLSKKSKAITMLATQLRKRNLTLYMTTQRFELIAKRLRILTDFIYALSPFYDKGHLIKGVAYVEQYDRADPFNDIPVRKFVFDGRQWFGHYDTKEVIH